jgi:hypothetical protein
VTRAQVPPPELADLNIEWYTRPFWEAAAQHRLVCARCEECKTFRMPPSPFCHECRSQDIGWVELSGEGSVYSFTVIRRAMLPVIEGRVPYVPAVVALDGAGGARLVSNIVDVEVEDVRIGMRVSVAWDDVAAGVTLPRFRPRPA